MERVMQCAQMEANSSWCSFPEPAPRRKIFSNIGSKGYPENVFRWSMGMMQSGDSIKKDTSVLRGVQGLIRCAAQEEGGAGPWG
jgi:hypothetical protein